MCSNTTRVLVDKLFPQVYSEIVSNDPSCGTALNVSRSRRLNPVLESVSFSTSQLDCSCRYAQPLGYWRISGLSAAILGVWTMPFRQSLLIHLHTGSALLTNALIVADTVFAIASIVKHCHFHRILVTIIFPNLTVAFFPVLLRPILERVIASTAFPIHFG